MKDFFKKYFIDTLSSMALGLFSTLIIGSILNQIGVVFNISFLTDTLYPALKTMTAPVIAVSVSYGLKADPLVIFACGGAGLIGGDPISALLCGISGSVVGMLISKRTSIDIIVTPIVTVLAAGIVGYYVGPIMQDFMAFLGDIIMKACEQEPFVMGILVSVIMGIILTLPISSAALGIMLNLSGLAAGAACVGCACQMVGFAVMSFKENKIEGLISQGLGTSMLQIGNIMKKPVLFLPPIITSAILGPVSTIVFKMTNTAYGAGMGTSGLVGQFGMIEAMGSSTGVIAMMILMHFVLPAFITLVISEIFRKKNIIKPGDLKLDLK
ncbi:PTS transporter subunit IIC [Anaerofustis butyriciformans]|uniref:PTS transporter subunit IIC n=1 Tax=Anaerofustis butyriciformans TaxID=3108533 RepID=UPI003F8AD757